MALALASSMTRRFSSARGRVLQAAIGAVLLLVPMAKTGLSEIAQASDPCEDEALRAYHQALDLCQLAESNPRSRCYEAAKAVYVHTLEECRARH